MEIRRFADPRKASAFVRMRDASANTKAIYTVLNPFDPTLIKSKGVDDASVTRRRRIFADCDPKRPADSNATDAEHAAAFAVAARIKEGPSEILRLA